MEIPLSNAFLATSTIFIGLFSFTWQWQFFLSPKSAERIRTEYAQDPVEFLCKTRKQLGDVFCVDLIVFKLVFCLGPEYNRLMLRAAEEDYSFWKQIAWAAGPKITKTITDKEWLYPTTKIVRSSLMNQERINVYVGDCAKIADEHFEKWTKSECIPLFKSVSYMVLSVMMTMLMGETFYRKYGNELVPKMDQFERDLQNPILRLLPWSLWKLSAPGRRHIQVANRFQELTTAEMEDILRHPNIHEGRTDHFYNVVQKFGRGFGPHYGAHIMTLVFAGHANVALTIPWMFLDARRHSGAWQRICDEVVLKPSEPKPYLEACLRETGRLYTNALLLRVTQKPTDIGGFKIPAGTFVACSPLATQREEESFGGVFQESRRWLPERFLQEGAYSEWFNKAEFVQFGMGPHQCPGEKLAKAMIYDVVLRTWLTNYVIEVVSGLEEDSKGIDGVGAQAAWTEENFGTPSIREKDVMIECRRRR